ncbi:MAG: competence/damage-inducible protein CinA-like protein [Acidimicrobiaceae bacterium]|nr:competence/damage-inducible protein CinA-like protein [Acidimicrobiaceae bacterium]
MRAEIVAVGTELLLGQNVDTNSGWIAQRLAESGIDCTHQVRVGDNVDRIADTLRIALSRADAAILTGGLGPTQDDLTREAIAKVAGVQLERDPDVMADIEAIFARRSRHMTESNRRQADVPVGATVIAQRLGTAPGLICPVGDQVVYALPGVPEEMKEMVVRAVLPDLRARSGETAVIASRVLRTWGLGESGLAELVAPRVDALEGGPPGAPTIAFLASGMEGIKVRVTVKTPDAASATAALDREEAALRELIGEGVFGTDEETMEQVVGELLTDRGLRLGLAESFTGGLIAARIVGVPGASRWFTGSVVAYDASVKRHILGVPDGPVVSAQAAVAMADGACRALGTDVALSTTGVAGPDPEEGLAPGTCFAGIALPGRTTEAVTLRLLGNRLQIREIATITALDTLRRRLLKLG